MDPDLLALAQEVDGRDSDSVEAGADLVTASAELAAGVEASETAPEAVL